MVTPASPQELVDFVVNGGKLGHAHDADKVNGQNLMQNNRYVAGLQLMLQDLKTSKGSITIDGSFGDSTRNLLAEVTNQGKGASAGMTLDEDTMQKLAEAYNKKHPNEQLRTSPDPELKVSPQELISFLENGGTLSTDSSKNPYVKTLQRDFINPALQAQGKDPIPVDGNYGDNTAKGLANIVNKFMPRAGSVDADDVAKLVDSYQKTHNGKTLETKLRTNKTAAFDELDLGEARAALAASGVQTGTAPANRHARAERTDTEIQIG